MPKSFPTSYLHKKPAWKCMARFIKELLLIQVLTEEDKEGKITLAKQRIKFSEVYMSLMLIDNKTASYEMN